TFLKQAGVNLPPDPSDQRKLWEGGENSLLAKYVAKFADQAPVFWQTTLTPVIAQSRLLGDVDKIILDMAVDPETTWQDISKRGLSKEFLDSISERYGFTVPLDDPLKWIAELVATLALTETYLGYGEPSDFPFLDRLPPLTVRSHHRDLLERWLKDTESRTAWDRLILDVENDINLTKWASNRDGLSFGFPHIVKARWDALFTEFCEAATKFTATQAFFEKQEKRIKREAEFARASHTPAGAWSLFERLGALVMACAEAETEMETTKSVTDLARFYTKKAPIIDFAHFGIRKEADELGLPEVAQVADRSYARYANRLNGHFFERFSQQPTADIDGIPLVTHRLEEKLWKASGRRAVIIVDGLRYDCAFAIQEALKGHDVKIEAVRAELPTITPIGMTALLPLGDANLSLEVKSNYPHPILNGTDCSQPKARLEYLVQFGADCRSIDDLESQSGKPEDLGELLVVGGHDELDHIGHGSADNLVRHLHLEIRRLARLIRKLHTWGYEIVHVVTDHGFILLEESKLPEEVPCEKDWCRVRKERFALVPASADIPLVTFPFAWDATLRVAVPPGLAFFKAEKSFSHGGASLQELIIPHLVSKSRTAKEKRIGVEVVLPTYELMQAAAKVLLRPVPGSVPKSGQMELFKEVGRTLSLDVYRLGKADEKESVLAGRDSKKVRLEADDDEKSVTLFFHSAESLQKGDLLQLEIRDVDTAEQFPSGGIKLTAGRDI
ncbi:MAG: PglZ domain-containing protein, partial [Pseudomonadota bacterium]